MPFPLTPPSLPYLYRSPPVHPLSRLFVCSPFPVPLYEVAPPDPLFFGMILASTLVFFANVVAGVPIHATTHQHSGFDLLLSVRERERFLGGAGFFGISLHPAQRSWSRWSWVSRGPALPRFYITHSSVPAKERSDQSLLQSPRLTILVL